MKRRVKSTKKRRVFEKNIQRWEKWKFYFREFWPFNPLVTLNESLSKHQLIKIDIVYVNIKPKVKKKMMQQQ